MDEPESTKANCPGSIAGQVRNGDASLVADDDNFDRASSSYEDGDLPSNFIRDFGNDPCDFRNNNFVGRDSSSINTFYLPDLTGL